MTLTHKQVDALEFLINAYPRGVGIEDEDSRAVFDSLIARDTGMVELVEWDESPTGDAYCLTDAGAEAFRAEAEETARSAENN